MAMSPTPYLVTQIDGETLRVGPASSITASMAEFIREHKAELLEELRNLSEERRHSTKDDTPLTKSDSQKPLELPEDDEERRRTTP